MATHMKKESTKEVPKFFITRYKELLEVTKRKTECPVCLDEFFSKNLKFSPCGHVFCDECFSKLKKCALCRMCFEVDDDDSSDDDSSDEDSSDEDSSDEDSSDDDSSDDDSTEVVIRVMYNQYDRRPYYDNVAGSWYWYREDYWGGYWEAYYFDDDGSTYWYRDGDWQAFYDNDADWWYWYQLISGEWHWW